MAEANRSLEEIVESAHSASSSHRPVGPFGPIPKNSGMEVDGTFARTPIVAGEMPRRRSNTSTASAAYHTVAESATDGSESAGCRTTSEHRSVAGAGAGAGAGVGATDSLLPSQLIKNRKSATYWSRSGDSSSARGSASVEGRSHRSSAHLVTSGSSSRSEPLVSRSRAAVSARRQMETAEAMTYEERHSTRDDVRRASDHERFRNVSSSAEESSGGARAARFPFQRAENGGMRVTEGMVAYQDRNLAILVADPAHTRLRVQAKEKHTKTTGSVTGSAMSADIHASFENLSINQQRALRDATDQRSSGGGSQRGTSERQERYYETSEYGSNRRQEGSLHSSRWEGGTARGEQRSSQAGGGGSQRGDGRAMSERSARGSGAGGGQVGTRSSLVRNDSGFTMNEHMTLGGSSSAGSAAELSSSRRRSLSPRPAASARLSQGEDAPGTLQRVMQPADDAGGGNETDGFTTRFVRNETEGSRKAASATTLYVAPTSTAAGAGRGNASAAAGEGFGRADGGVDEAGYPRRASGDWRRRSSAMELVIEDEVCDLEEREEVISGGATERLSYHRADAESSLEKSARRSQQQRQQFDDEERAIPGGNRYKDASGGPCQKRELGCLAEEAVRSSSSLDAETDCYIEVSGTEVPVVSWAVRRYSRYLQQLGRQSPRRLILPQGSGSAAALCTAAQWCYLPASEAERLITTENCEDVYRAACALDIPELMEQCRRLLEDCERQESRPASKVTYDTSSKPEDGGQRVSQRQIRGGGGGDDRGMRVLVNAPGDEEYKEDYREENYREEYQEDYREEEPRLRPRRSSFGSSSPKRSYSRLYTREEHEAATVIQSGYRGFRARQQLKERGIELGSSSSRRRSSAASATSYSRRAPAPQSSSSQARRVSSVLSSSRRDSSPPRERSSARLVVDLDGGSERRSRSDVQPRPVASSAQEPRQRSSFAATAREEREERVDRQSSREDRQSSSATDGFQTVYEHRSAVSTRPSPSSQQSDRRSSQTGGARASQTGGARASRRDTAVRQPSRSRSRSGSRSRVSFSRPGPASSQEEHAALVIQRNYRSYSARVHYEEKRYAAATLQRYMRGHLARKHVKEMHEAAAKIQNCFRQHLDEKRAMIDPEVSDLAATRVVSSSSDWKCRSLLHPEGSTVLVMSGLNPMQDYCAKYNSGRDMYRYQAFQNAWEYVGQVPEPRHHASVAYLRGLVYLVGGTDPRVRAGDARCRPLNTVWVLDPATGDWWQAPAMRHARVHHGTAVAQGQLYVIGGQDEDGCALTSVELFDPDRNAWSEITPLGCARLGIAAAVHHHRIWVVGGMCPAKKQDVVNAVDIYDTIRKRWCQGPPLRQPRCFARLVVSARRLFLVGGAGRSTRHQKAISSVDTVDRFAEEQGAWVHVAQMKTSRHGHAVVPQGEQEFLILGGVSSQDAVALSLVEQYNARSNQWIRGVAKLPSPLSGLAAVTIPPPKRGA